MSSLELPCEAFPQFKHSIVVTRGLCTKISIFYLSTENCHKEGFQDPSYPYDEGNNENAYFCHD